MQVKKLGYILFVGVIATICILPVAVMPWQTEKRWAMSSLHPFLNYGKRMAASIPVS